MSAGALVELLGVFDALRPAFTQPGYRNAMVIMAGWILTNGRHAVTQALVATDVARRRHHETFHRFFSRGAWEPDNVGLILFGLLVRLVPEEAPLSTVIDDTLAAKKGPKVFGIGSHIDAVRSTKAVRVFCFGHVWVVMAVVVRLPFSQRAWALPVLFRLYRSKKECARKSHPYSKKTELAREMVQVFATWIQDRTVHLTADSAYCNDTVMRHLPANFVVVGAMRPDAVLTALPQPKVRKTRGRRPVRGKLLPKPQALARNKRHAWKRCQAVLYGVRRTVYYKTILGQWYRACGGRLLHVVVVRVDTGTAGIRVFFSTDPEMSVKNLLETYAGRWSIEVCFRDLKQLLGFADSSARKRQAVERVAPFVGYIYTLLVVWFAQGVHQTSIATPPVRPWYRHKRGFCFADIIRAAQRALLPLDILDPARSLHDLREKATVPAARRLRRRKTA